MKLIATAAIALFLVGGCVSVPDGLQEVQQPEGYEIPVVIHNFVNERGSFWYTKGGSVARRLGECDAQSTCNFKLSAEASEYYARLGTVTLGFQHMFDRSYQYGLRPIAFVQTAYFDNMLVTLTLNSLEYYLVPKVNPQVDR